MNNIIQVEFAPEPLLFIIISTRLYCTSTKQGCTPRDINLTKWSRFTGNLHFPAIQPTTSSLPSTLGHHLVILYCSASFYGQLLDLASVSNLSDCTDALKKIGAHTGKHLHTWLQRLPSSVHPTAKWNYKRNSSQSERHPQCSAAIDFWLLSIVINFLTTVVMWSRDAPNRGQPQLKLAGGEELWTARPQHNYADESEVTKRSCLLNCSAKFSAKNNMGTVKSMENHLVPLPRVEVLTQDCANGDRPSSGDSIVVARRLISTRGRVGGRNHATQRGFSGITLR